ncbi:hypothetical protein FPOAC1_006360 [Fusarium poae]|uniref:hypothetical protein n=1 Tax=Fusarium poae TaxID=36050 RepID=UPI001CE82469|nr:hypothetical protein FPOAC1_006360 [Fusarium poae]KAG8673057.1 hypothetical protein FPOAC1_006360 [Fusarium poae]
MSDTCAPHSDYSFPRDFKGYGEKGVQGLEWPNNAKIAVSFVINYEEGAEHSIENGDEISETTLREFPGTVRINERDYNAESEYEYGSRVGFWRLFKLFNKNNMKFTLYAVAQALEQQPEVATRCVQEGHDVASHGYRWVDHHEWPIEKEKEYIRKGINSLKSLTGYVPKGWYYGRPSPRSRTLVPQVYQEMGEELIWASDTYADDVPYWIDLPSERNEPSPKGCLMVPYSYDCNDFKFHTVTGFNDPDGFYTHLKNAFDVLYGEGEDGEPKMMTVGLHCRIIGRPGRFKALKDFVDYIALKDGVWVATRTEIAEVFKAQFPYNSGQLAGDEKVIAKIRDDQLTVEEYAESLLARIKERDPIVRGWVYLNPDQVLYEARKLDEIPKENRGPLHGVAVAVKDVIYTKDMPTQFNSPIYEGDAPQVDAASVIILRKAGALIFGKTATTEFAATTEGPATTNPHDSSRTPGGSSSGSGAVVGDFQVPIALGTQTGGSTIRPASFNGIYGFKPTWNSISREGQKMFSIINDTIGFYSRSVADLNLLADVFALEDDEPPNPDEEVLLKELRIGICKTMVWPQAGYGLVNAMIKAIELLRSNGATVTEIEFPDYLKDLPDWYFTIFNSDGRTAFLPEYRLDKSRIADQLVGHVENRMKITRAAQLKAFDAIAAARPVVDDMLSQYDAVLTPSVPDEAPEGLESTGSAAFCQIWTVLHNPVINVPGFRGYNGMPIGLSLVAPRYHDRKLLAVSEVVGRMFVACLS